MNEPDLLITSHLQLGVLLALYPEGVVALKKEHQVQLDEVSLSAFHWGHLCILQGSPDLPEEHLSFCYAPLSTPDKGMYRHTKSDPRCPTPTPEDWDAQYQLYHPQAQRSNRTYTSQTKSRAVMSTLHDFTPSKAITQSAAQRREPLYFEYRRGPMDPFEREFLIWSVFKTLTANSCYALLAGHEHLNSSDLRGTSSERSADILRRAQEYLTLSVQTGLAPCSHKYDALSHTPTARI